MTPTDIITLHEFIDNALKNLRQSGLMRLPNPDMPMEMRDTTVETRNDWVPWKAIASTVSDAEIDDLEKRTQLCYPDLYIKFLKHKHFYELPQIEEIQFYRHGIYEWKEELLDQYHTELLEQGYIPFANYSDWGIVCFNTKKQSKLDKDCQIVMIDHDLLYDSSISTEILYSSFAEMIQILVKEQEAPKRTE